MVNNGVKGLDHDFQTDNIAVWKVLHHAVKDTEYVIHIKKFQKRQDGRKAFLALHASLLGRQAIDNHTGAAETKLQSLTWDGKVRKNWSFTKYILAHKEQHIILEKLKDFGSYGGIDENAKRRYFLQGIHDASLNPVISSISGDMSPKTFDECVEQFNNYIQQKKLYTRPTARTVNVSEMSTQSGNRKADKTKKTNLNDDGFDKNKDYSKHKTSVRYYSPAEWNKLSKGQRNYLRQARLTKKSKEVNKDTKIAALEATIQALSAQIGTKRKSDDTSTTESETSDDTLKPIKKTRIKSTKRG